MLSLSKFPVNTWVAKNEQKKLFHLTNRIDYDLHIAQSYPISMECQSERTNLALLVILRLTFSTNYVLFSWMSKNYFRSLLNEINNFKRDALARLRDLCYFCVVLSFDLVQPGAYEQEHATPLHFCHGVFIHRFIFRSWEVHNQLQDTNWRHYVTGPELPFFHKRKGELKTDQSVNMPWHRLSMGVASSCSSAPVSTHPSLHSSVRPSILPITLTSIHAFIYSSMNSSIRFNAFQIQNKWGRIRLCKRLPIMHMCVF